MKELESSMMSQHVMKREIKKDVFSDDHISSVTSETPDAVQGFYFGISYSKMCKYSHITLLEYEGKKHVEWWIKLLVPQNIGTLKGVIADHWNQETPVYHYLLLLSACFL